MKIRNASHQSTSAISVVIPMYNAEKYIGECLTSLANQTFQDFDVIVVDDCSTDNSRAIVNNFFDTFGGRLKLKKLTKNSGYPGLPRNSALDMVRGKYVYFLDSDDLLSKTAFEELYTVAEKFNADVVHSDKYFTFDDEKGLSSAKSETFQRSEFVTEPTLITDDIGERITGFVQRKYLWWACNKLFRRQFLRDNKIKFPATKSWEDFIFIFSCLVSAKNYVRVPFVSYYYRFREDSMSRNAGNIIEISKRAFVVCSALDKVMESKTFFRDNPQYRYAVLDFFIKDRLSVTSKYLFADNASPAAVFDFFYKNIFSFNPQDNVALTAYLFVMVNALTLYSKQQATEIKLLKKKLEVSS